MPCKHKGLSLVHRSQVKIYQKIFPGRQQILEAHRPASLAYLGSSRLLTVSKNKADGM